MAYLVAEHEPADEERRRIEKTMLTWLAGRLQALRDVQVEFIHERQFIEQMDGLVRKKNQMPDEQQVLRIKDLLWKFRRQLPDHARPRLPPRDPIVLEMEKHGGD